jgi:hypothetical protein
VSKHAVMSTAQREDTARSIWVATSPATRLLVMGLRDAERFDALSVVDGILHIRIFNPRELSVADDNHRRPSTT